MGVSLSLSLSLTHSLIQQDSQEFLAVLLDKLHEDVVQSNSKGGEGVGGGGGRGGRKERAGPCSSNEDNHSIITETFQGQLKNEVSECSDSEWMSGGMLVHRQVTCCVCGHTSTKTDPFIYLSLPLPHSHEMQLGGKMQLPLPPPPPPPPPPPLSPL